MPQYEKQCDEANSKQQLAHSGFIYSTAASLFFFHIFTPHHWDEARLRSELCDRLCVLQTEGL